MKVSLTFTKLDPTQSQVEDGCNGGLYEECWLWVPLHSNQCLNWMRWHEQEQLLQPNGRRKWGAAMEGEDILWAFHVNVILYISSIFSKISYASFIRPIILMMHGFLIGISSKISHLAYTFSKSELMLSWSIFRACKVGEVLKLYQYKA